MSEEKNEPSAVGFGFGARRTRKNQGQPESQPRPNKWSPGVIVTSAEEYDRFTDQLARELLATCTPEHLAVIAAQHMIYVNTLQQASEAISKLNETQKELTKAQGESLQRAQLEYQYLVDNTAKITRLVLNEFSAYRARKSVGTRHDKPGASRDLKRKIQEIWATGKYTSRDICAEQEWSDLGYGSLATARKALRGTPDPT